MTSVLWLRRDLRVHDHPALHAAADDGPVVPLIVLDPTLIANPDRPRTAAFLHAVAALREDLHGLIVRMGDAEQVVAQVCAEAGARRVHVSGESHPYGRRRDARVRKALADKAIKWIVSGTPYAVSPGLLSTRAGGPFQVFTPFARVWRDHGFPAPLPAPSGVRFRRGVTGDELPQVSEQVPLSSSVTEAQAHERWADFLEDGLAAYGSERNRPDHDATSRLSTALKLGTIHPRTLAYAVGRSGRARENGAQRFLTELAWREFYADVLWHHPRSAWHDLRDGLTRLAYDSPDDDPVAAARLRAWQDGQTGYPIVDAGMRQLRAEGWMHNRVRMITASFLTKDLHLSWTHGARHFLDLLTDGDIASNNHGWQWVAGTGTDAAPYFRVFNPITQGQRFDPEGDYVRRHVPELRHLAGSGAHEPWRAADGLAHGYPERLIDHAAERREALRRYESTRTKVLG